MRVLVTGFMIAVVFATASAAYATDGPTIDVWYVDANDNLEFGQVGVPQTDINILGNVYDPQGVATLTYSLNGGSPVTLSMGPDTRRLHADGDFNADIPTSALNLAPATNSVLITATDSALNVSTRTITVSYTNQNVWSLPYSIDWSGVTSIPDAAQVTDGLWDLDPIGVRTTLPGYDRHLAIGDLSWQNYEVETTATVHSFGASPFIGLALRWNGNSDDPVSGWQPQSGWFPVGAFCWYNHLVGALEIYSSSGTINASAPFTMTVGQTYKLKARVETPAGSGSVYRFKVWNAAETEPSAWNCVASALSTDSLFGSALLSAVRADVSFGDVTVAPPVDASLGIDDIRIFPNATGTEQTILWTTNQPCTTSIEYGTTSSYGTGPVTDPALVTHHSVTLTGLTPGTLYYYLLKSTSSSGAFVTEEITSSGYGSGIVSDDFSSGSLNTSLWTFVNPLSDGVMAFQGTGTPDAALTLSVPALTNHNNWTTGIKAPHIEQSANDTDFEVEVKFESPVSQTYEIQGILVKESASRWLRFDFYGTGGKTYVFAGSVDGTVGVSHVNLLVSDGPPLYMRVRREGDEWYLRYSPNGRDWTVAGSFLSELTVTKVAAHAGNSGTNPAFTGVIDYVFNAVLPIQNEDDTPFELIDIQSSVTQNSATITWQTNIPGTSRVDYGLTSAYLLGNVSDGAYLLQHSIELTGLTAGTEYHYKVTSVDGTGALAGSADLTFETSSAATDSGIQSDDFSSGALNSSIWTFMNPTADGSMAFSGSGTSNAWVNLSVPTGMTHDPWTSGILAPHLLQTINDTDFEVEVKFESSVAEKYQIQGILVKQDASNFLRFDFFHNGFDTRVFACDVANLVGTYRHNQPAPSGAPMYMRVRRQGDFWTQTFSYDGQNWGPAASFTHAMQVTGIGPHCSNAGSANPAHTASIDYFFNVASPIVPEDGPGPGAGIKSDDFSSGTLDTNVWSFVNPAGAGAMTFSGAGTQDAWLEISAPAGANHDAWINGILAPHLLQSVSDADFEVEVRFESSISGRYQIQGVLVKQDASNFLRFDFYSNGTETRIFASDVTNLVGNYRVNNVIPDGAQYMRIKREGNLWTQTYSYDGLIWQPGASFTHAITVTGIGPHSSNASDSGANAPAHDTFVDYFFNVSDPVLPEDAVLTLSNINVATTATDATVTWTTNLLSDSAVQHGQTTSYLLGTVSDSTLAAHHSITLPNLSPDTDYHFKVTSDAGNGKVSSSGDLQFRTEVLVGAGLVTDQFNAGTLNTSIWTFIDPLNDATLAFQGGAALITVPAGVTHDSWTWGINAPHLVQTANDVDFEVEVKFTSAVAAGYQIQGIMVKESPTHFIRFDFFSNGSSSTVFAGAIDGTSGTQPIRSYMPDGVPIYMRVRRVGNTWTQLYSYDGQAWLTSGTFTHAMNVTAVGPYAGNAGANPSHTAAIDYFIDRSTP